MEGILFLYRIVMNLATTSTQPARSAPDPSASISAATRPPVDHVDPSLLDRFVPHLSAQILQACLAEADLVPYRVRQALNQTLDRATTQELVSQVLSLPHSLQSYTRHMLHADPGGMFTVVALRWDPSQGSPIHAHYTWCAYKVLSGAMTESHFEWDRTANHAYLFNRVVREAGQSVSAHGGMECIHRLSNDTEHTAVSIHVYGIDAARISTHVNRMVDVRHDIR